MRYEELSLPLAGGLFQIRFHQQVTILSGLSGADRAALVDAFAAAAAGEVPDGTLVYRDRDGRRVVIRDRSTRYLDDGSDAGPSTLGQCPDAKEMRSLLLVGTDDLGLPHAVDDPGQVVLQSELLEARQKMHEERHTLTEASNLRIRRERILNELEKTETTLASLGTPADRYLHDRAHTLVELEQVRALIAAVDLDPEGARRDELLLRATDEVQTLADDWAEASARLDQLRIRSRDREPLESTELAASIDIPDTAPAGLSKAIADYESSSARCDHLAKIADDLTKRPHVTSPSDPRVLVLSTLDQESLWFLHRRVVLATEALASAREEEANRSAGNSGILSRAETAHEAATASSARAEHLWLRGILTATICICLALLLPLAGYSPLLAPVFLVAAAASLMFLVFKPRWDAKSAAQRAEEIMRETGASDIHEYRLRVAGDPSSSKWQQADRIVDEYQNAMEEWASLVGDMSIADVSSIEEEIHAWVEAQDTNLRASQATSARRSLDHAQSDLAESAERLRILLKPFGLQPQSLPVAIGAVVHERIQLGKFARLQVELGEAEEAEGKLTQRLEDYLCSIGFEDGCLEARIGAYGWAIDRARQRHQLRSNAPPIDELNATRERLEQALTPPAPGSDARPTGPQPDEGHHISDLRTRRDELRAQAAEITIPDEHGARQRLTRLETRVHALEEELSPEAGMLVAKPIDHLVDTLVKFRPSWPGTTGDVLPAILDGPFGAIPPQLRRQLLDALFEVAKVTQIILLTSDPRVVEWARPEAQRGRLRLLEPVAETA